jgi:hypothetical protein
LVGTSHHWLMGSLKLMTKCSSSRFSSRCVMLCGVTCSSLDQMPHRKNSDRCASVRARCDFLHFSCQFSNLPRSMLRTSLNVYHWSYIPSQRQVQTSRIRPPSYRS